MKPIQTKAELIGLLVANGASIVGFGVSKIGFFGSFATNKIHDNSDIDFFVVFEKDRKNYDNFFDLYTLLKTNSGRNIELITPESLSKHIGKHI